MWRWNMTRGRGFTLLEIMVALTLLATAFVAVLRLHSDSIEMIIESRTHTKAAELAQFKLNEIGIGGFGSISLLTGDFGDLAPDYSWIIDLEPTPLANWMKVTVRVGNSAFGEERMFSLTEYMSKNPLRDKKDEKPSSQK
jgi:prepilin-type N-terminal cleavage/methylation domain-containing protein